jgi:hypothetical protein
MADLSISRVCPACGTLTTASGAFTDKQLHGSCPRCSTAGTPTGIVIDNPRYAPPTEKPGPAIEEGKHSPELTEKYFDATGKTGPAPFRAPGDSSNAK